MKHLPPPVGWVPETKRKYALILLALISLALLMAMRVLDRPLRTVNAPNGIVSFEFAGTAGQASAIIDSWSTDARVAAGVSLGLDYLFLIAYAATIALACGMAAEALTARGSRLGRWGLRISWAQWIAAACDMVENLMLILLLRGASAPGLAETAWGCAAIKFSLVGIGLAYAAAGLLLLKTILRDTAPEGEITE